MFRALRVALSASVLLLAGAPASAEDAAKPPRALEPVQRPEPPTVRDAAWCCDPLDRFILARLEAAGLSPAPEAGRRELIRRMAFDVTGLPPSPGEVEAFLEDARPDAVERLVDSLLASPAYGERWARHWLDVVGFAETNGFETNTPRDNAWPYRDYVIRALNEDIPYPTFIGDQLAGDVRGEHAATGFLVAGPYDTVKSPDPKLTAEQRANELHDMVSAVGTTFLGLTVGCARCHDHKFDPISQREYYAIEAMLAGVEHGEREVPSPDREERERKATILAGEIASIDERLWSLEPAASPGAADSRRPPVSPLRNVDRFPPIETARIRFTVLSTNNLEPCIDELEVYTSDRRNVALASAGARAAASSEYPNSEIHRIVHLNDGRHGNSRSWISNEGGSGWAEIRLARPEVVERVIWGRDREGKYADRLATAYRIEAELEGGGWRTLASSEDRGSASGGGVASPAAPLPPELEALLSRRSDLEARRLELLARPRIYAGVFRQPGPTRLLNRGDPMDPREEVAPGGIAALGVPLELPSAPAERDRRIALVRWLSDPRNPLPARVLANRIWQHHFGRGIVATPNDFGRMGSPASHPELLDWLAAELIESGWRMKSLHRRILLSSTYRQSSRLDPRAAALDAGAVLLWRYPPRRLEAEALRDSILWASGKLDLARGGPGYEVFEPNANYVRVYEPRSAFGPGEWRRMIYQRKPRKEQDSTFGIFDCPDGTRPAPRRAVSTSAVQALNLLHSPFVVEQAAFFAERVEREAGGDPAEAVRRAFVLAFAREPSPEEARAARDLAREHGLPAVTRALYNSNEFIHLE